MTTICHHFCVRQVYPESICQYRKEYKKVKHFSRSQVVLAWIYAFVMYAFSSRTVYHLSIFGSYIAFFNMVILVDWNFRALRLPRTLCGSHPYHRTFVPQEMNAQILEVLRVCRVKKTANVSSSDKLPATLMPLLPMLDSLLLVILDVLTFLLQC